MNEKLSGHAHPAKRRRRLVLLGVATSLAVFLAACGDDDDSPSAAADEAAADDCVATATERFEDAMAPMTISAGEPFDASFMEGETVAMVQFAPTGNPVQEAFADSTTEAMAVVGAEVQFFDGQGRADLLAQHVQSAISQGVAGIILDGFDPQVVARSIEDAQAANIPVFATDGIVGEDMPAGVSAHLAVDAESVGRVQAAYALAQTNCQLQAVTMEVSGATLPNNMANGAVEEINELCPDDCSIEVMEVNPATFISDLAGEVQTTLQRNPDLNYWITTVDFFMPYILQGMEAVDRPLPVVGGARGDGLDDAIAGTNGMSAVTLWPPLSITGYMYADAMIRAIDGQPAEELNPVHVMPVRLVDSTNWGTSADPDEQFPELVDWRDAFIQSWGG